MQMCRCADEENAESKVMKNFYGPAAESLLGFSGVALLYIGNPIDQSVPGVRGTHNWQLTTHDNDQKLSKDRLPQFDEI